MAIRLLICPLSSFPGYPIFSNSSHHAVWLLNLLCLSNSHFAHPDPHLPYPPPCCSPYEHIFLQRLHVWDPAIFTLLSLAYHSGVTVLLCTAGLTLPSLCSYVYGPHSPPYVSYPWGLRSSLGLAYRKTAMIMRYQTWTIYICLLFLLCPQAPNRIEHIKEIKAKVAWRVLTRSPNPPLTVFPGHGKARHQLGSKVHFIHFAKTLWQQSHWLCSNDRRYGNSKGRNANRLMVKLNPRVRSSSQPALNMRSKHAEKHAGGH